MDQELPIIINMVTENKSFTSYLIGLILAISSSIFIGSSFIIKKIALKKISDQGNVRASAGGYSYLRQWMWWLGLLTMGIGEGANLLAYGFVPAALVTPLGALSILVTAVLSSKFLNEKLHFVGKIGCLLCVIGSVILVVHSPRSDNISSFTELKSRLFDHVFVSYVLIVTLSILFLKIFLVHKLGKTNVSIYLSICSGIGSLTVVFCKGVALGFKEGISINDMSNLGTLIFLIAMAIAGMVMQLNYLNKSLDIFSTTIVTPVYYVMFTVLVIVSSGILFKEWEKIGYQDIIGCIIGFIILVIAVFMLNMYKNPSVIDKYNNRAFIDL
ncbi:magnesium transporter NIPA3 [Leptidea sinapis]|uniref:magnesium transporter NIPA3 n=1 Tax=Leptidea sinapis TaxID=189913 RepID=UPI002130926E|nr:magnesium transporter NIPA3 [Leptidea sinapis]